MVSLWSMALKRGRRLAAAGLVLCRVHRVPIHNAACRAAIQDHRRRLLGYSLASKLAGSLSRPRWLPRGSASTLLRSSQTLADLSLATHATAARKALRKVLYDAARCPRCNRLRARPVGPTLVDSYVDAGMYRDAACGGGG